MSRQKLLQQAITSYSQIIPVNRKTREVEINGYINLYGNPKKPPHVHLISSERDVNNISWFMGHMWEQFFKYASIEARIRAKGDDYHHLTEDLAIVIGQAQNTAMRNRESMYRSGAWFWPFEGQLGIAIADYAGRSRATCTIVDDIKNVELRETFEHTCNSYSREAGVDVIGYAITAPRSMSRLIELLEILNGSFYRIATVGEDVLEKRTKRLMYKKIPMDNDHHKTEAFMKAFGRATKIAKSIDVENIGVIPSTKGMLK